jgi:hypothetical protein
MLDCFCICGLNGWMIMRLKVPIPTARWHLKGVQLLVQIYHSFDALGQSYLVLCPEQGGKLLGLLLAGSTGQHMAGRNGLA